MAESPRRERGFPEAAGNEPSLAPRTVSEHDFRHAGPFFIPIRQAGRGWCRSRLNPARPDGSTARWSRRSIRIKRTPLTVTGKAEGSSEESRP